MSSYHDICIHKQYIALAYMFFNLIPMIGLIAPFYTLLFFTDVTCLKLSHADPCGSDSVLSLPYGWTFWFSPIVAIANKAE